MSRIDLIVDAINGLGGSGSLNDIYQPENISIRHKTRHKFLIMFIIAGY